MAPSGPASTASPAPARGGRLLWPLAHLCGLGAALWIAWLALVQVDLLYPLWHGLLDIDAHVAEYGPQNRYRRGFEQTDSAEHQRLFAAVLAAIHRDGDGLAELRYRARDGRDLGPLLREPEIVHLRDVARLVSLGGRVGWAALLVWAALAAGLLLGRVPMPALRSQLLVLAAPVLVALVALAVAGPVEVFYALHEWLFPPGHQWFFYYQESLMTTLMKAPDLFGGMAAQWFALTALLVAGQWWGLVLSARRRAGTPR